MKTKTKYLAVQYANMKKRVTGKDPKSKYYIGKPICTYTQYVYWALDRRDFKRIWRIYEASGFDTQLCPSIDRLDISGGYTLDNMRFVPRRENRRGAKNYFKQRLDKSESAV